MPQEAVRPTPLQCIVVVGTLASFFSGLPGVQRQLSRSGPLPAGAPPRGG